MDRAEARRKLENSTRFQFNGDRLVVRNVALVAAFERLGSVKEEIGATMQDARSQEAMLNLAA